MSDTPESEDFESIIGDELRSQFEKVDGALAIESLDSTLNDHLAPMLDSLIKFAAGRRMQMMAYGFTNEDASYMFAAIIERLWPQKDSMVDIMATVIESLSELSDDDD